jgi:hypothetical protein
MTTGRIPKPYINDVKQDDSTMVYVPFENMDIGSRKSGTPANASSGPKSLQHVGDSASRSAKKK